MSKAYLPYFVAGEIVKGFGRGSKELGCPTGKWIGDTNESSARQYIQFC